MKTPVCEMLGIELPVFAFSHCRDVVAEVSRAGGMGVLGVAGFTAERLEEELAWIDAHCDGKPYGIDILIPNRYSKGAGAGGDSLLEHIPAEHRSFLEQLCRDADIAPLPTGEAERIMQAELARINMTPESAEKLLEVALRHPIKLLVNALGTPPREMVERLQARGVRVGSMVGALEHARAQVEAGVDLLIAQGCEAGGHTGRITSMILWPQVVDAVAPIPVLAAGGIGRGRQMAAALALGAQGVWCGSIWLGSDKSDLGPELKSRKYWTLPIVRTRSEWRDHRRRLVEEGILGWPEGDNHYSNQVKSLLLKALVQQQAMPRLQDIAGTLCMSAQTLHRHLQHEGNGYQRILDDLRRDYAIELLAKQHLSIAAAAECLGFAEARSFSRAFKQWTGLPPSAVRRNGNR